MKYKSLICSKYYPAITLPNCYYINRFGKVIDSNMKIVNDITSIDFSTIDTIFIFTNENMDEDITDVSSIKSIFTLNQISVINYIEKV